MYALPTCIKSDSKKDVENEKKNLPKGDESR